MINANKRVIDYFNDSGHLYDGIRMEELKNEIIDLNKIKKALINYKI